MRGRWRGNGYRPELRERAVRMAAEVRPEYPSDWPAIKAGAAKLGIGSAETLRKWVRQAEADGGTRPGATSGESAELRKLRAEVRDAAVPGIGACDHGQDVIVVVAAGAAGASRRSGRC